MMTWLLMFDDFVVLFYWNFIYFHAKISPIIHKNRTFLPIDIHLLLVVVWCCCFFIFYFIYLRSRRTHTKKSWKLLLFYLFTFNISLLFFLICCAYSIYLCFCLCVSASFLLEFYYVSNHVCVYNLMVLYYTVYTLNKWATDLVYLLHISSHSCVLSHSLRALLLLSSLLLYLFRIFPFFYFDDCVRLAVYCIMSNFTI